MLGGMKSHNLRPSNDRGKNGREGNMLTSLESGTTPRAVTFIISFLWRQLLLFHLEIVGQRRVLTHRRQRCRRARETGTGRRGGGHGRHYLGGRVVRSSFHLLEVIYGESAEEEWINYKNLEWATIRTVPPSASSQATSWQRPSSYAGP